MIEVEELWSQDDQYALDLCIGAVAHDNLGRALLAVEGTAHQRQRDVERTLADWAEELDVTDASPVAQADALRTLMVERLGFRGNHEHYHQAENSLLSVVVERRRGLPILLSAVWMIVGRNAGIPVSGIGLPGHFIVHVGGDDGLYLDPFGGGDHLSEQECRLTAEKHAAGSLQWKESFLDPVDTQAIVARVSHNLVATYNEGRDAPPLYRALRFLEAMRPHDPEIPMMRAEAAVSVGAFPRALRIYRAIASQYPDSDAASNARDRLERLRGLNVAEG